MKVMVTGASGSIGTAVLRALAAEETELVGIARREPEPVYPYDRARWVRCDIGAAGAADTLRAAFDGAAAVVHLAWAIHPRSTDPPRQRTNRIGSANVLAAVADTAVSQLICLSSAAAYAPAGRWQTVTERWPLRGVPGSAYSRDKAVLETQLDRFVRAYPATRVARLRPGGVLHPDAAAELADWALPAWFPRSLIGRTALPVPAWKHLRLQVIHADDVAAAVRSALESRAAGAFNLAAEPVLTADRLARIFGGFRLPMSRRVLAAMAWASWRLGAQPLHPGWLTLADRVALLDTSRARTELGWTPSYDAEATVRALGAALSARRTGASPPLTPVRPRLRLGEPSHQSQRDRAQPG
ncbi:NAD-dependent epimerase/dehydratase family protein [Nocardia yunnanensis]|uniref:NAD-dependent epimerase/dehydratase family protein n=1 Tax=Nocardia yunnanensis TaxID=2382165 RepID=A0A386ZH88_9NOCA|nr:NAD-dependent epimerase/dehydratase family protein [Nocardia yunnanensis]AYF76897.1 NAD-dependent epimerase/dehydratase family protein [Nocardia yunnanensis]